MVNWMLLSTIVLTSIDAGGFKGPDCEQATEFLEEALGVVSQEIKKPEYHQRNTKVSPPRSGG